MTIAPNDFTHLHVHTEYSLLDGFSNIKKLIQRAKEMNMPALALTDHGTMFGGLVVALMDKCAGLCVARWSGRVSVTASIDAIQFKTPIRQGQMVEAVARVIFVSRTSCVVRVQVFAHNLQAGLKEFCCEGYFNMVGIDPDGHPALLPLIPHETPEEQADWEHGAEIHAAMLARRGRKGGSNAARDE